MVKPPFWRMWIVDVGQRCDLLIGKLAWKLDPEMK